MLTSKHPRFIAFVNLFMIAALYFAAAAAAHNGFYRKYGLRDGEARFSIDLMLDGTADRPFIYRQLLPLAANFVDSHMPERLKSALQNTLTATSLYYEYQTAVGLRKGLADQKPYAIRYYIIYMAAFASYYAALFLMRYFCFKVGASYFAATAAPLIFSLLFPVLLSVGGYFYDFTELFLFFLTLSLAFDARTRLLIIPLAVIGTLNKESYLFFLLSISPLLIRSRDDFKSIAQVVLSVGVSGITYLVVRSYFASNPGAGMENHLLQNLLYYPNPASLFQASVIYGIPMFAGYSLVTVVMVAYVVNCGWKWLSPTFKRYGLLSLSINLPLVVALCYPGEMRNFSICFPILIALIALTIDALLKQSRIVPGNGSSC